MKKLLILVVLSLVLVGCSNAYVNVSNPRETILSVGDSTFSKEHFFSIMMNQDPATLVVEMAKRIIMDQELPVNDEVRAKAQEDLEYVKELFGEAFLTNISLYGFTSEQDYFDRALIPSAQESLLTEKFIDENFDLLVTTYSPRKVRIIEFNDLTKATDALEAIRAGGNVEEVANEYSTSVSYKGVLKLVHKESGLPSAVSSFISQSEVPTLTSTPIEQESTGKYYVVQVVEVASNRFADEIVEELALLNSVNQMMFINYFQEGNFDVYDKAILDALMQSYKDYLPNR
jgi:foldase protein PrsA